MKKQNVCMNVRNLILIAVALLCTTNAYAANSAQGVLGDLMSSVFAPLDAFQAALKPTGLRLIAGLMILHVVAGGVMLAAGTTDMFDLIIKGIKLSIVACLAGSAVVEQPWLGDMTGAGGAVTLTQAIMLGFDKLALLAGGAGGDWVNLGGGNRDGYLFVHIVDGMFKGLSDIINLPIYKPDSSWLEDFVTTINPLTWIAIAYWIATVFMYVLTCGVMLLELLGAMLTIKFATVFAPLLVPWVLFKPMSFLFTSWLRALLIGGMGFLVALLMLSGFSSFIIAAAKVITTNTTDATLMGSGAALTFLPILLGCFVFFLLAPKANNIASGLISGSGVDGVSLKTLGQSMRPVNTAASAPAQLRGSAANAARSVVPAIKSVASGIGAAGSAALKGGSAAAAATSQTGTANKSMAALGGALAGTFSAAKSGVANSGSVSQAELNSPGGRATGDVAKAAGKDKSITASQFKESTGFANAAFNQSRAEGGSVASSKVAAQKAAVSYLSGVSKNDKPNVPSQENTPVRRLTPSMMKGKT
jgi:TrbL/VirB6 plasmid conjugal transfer protein